MKKRITFNKLLSSNIKRIGFLLLLSSAMVFVSLDSKAASVFKVSKDTDSVFIAGTMHLLTASDYPLPTPFTTAYELSDELYFETNIDAIESSEFLQSSLKVLMQQDGGTLHDILSEKTVARLKSHLSQRGIPFQQIIGYTPAGVMLTLSIMEYQIRGFTAKGVDKYFFETASESGKSIAWFESPEEQLSFIAGLESKDPNDLINFTLDDINNLDVAIQDLHQGWKDGDMKALAKEGLESFQAHPDMYQLLIKNRNDQWIKKIEAMYHDNNTELVLVGALHLPGPDGLLTQLEQKGYVVEQLVE